MTATAIAVGLFCLLLLGCGIFVTRMLWHEPSPRLDADPESVWGEGLRSRLPRALPVLINGFALCGLALTPAIAKGDCTGTCEYDGATAVVTMIGLGLGVAMLVLALTTLLAGRPRFLIPPSVRPGRSHDPPVSTRERQGRRRLLR
jgi:hypothetical protein